MNRWTQRFVRALLIAIVAMVAVTTLLFAASVFLGMVVVLLLILAVGYAANPTGFAETARDLRAQLSAWIDQLQSIVTTFMDSTRNMIDAALARGQAPADETPKDPPVA